MNISVFCYTITKLIHQVWVIRGHLILPKYFLSFIFEKNKKF